MSIPVSQSIIESSESSWGKENWSSIPTTSAFDDVCGPKFWEWNSIPTESLTGRIMKGPTKHGEMIVVVSFDIFNKITSQYEPHQARYLIGKYVTAVLIHEKGSVTTHTTCDSLRNAISGIQKLLYVGYADLCFDGKEPSQVCTLRR